MSCAAASSRAAAGTPQTLTREPHRRSVAEGGGDAPGGVGRREDEPRWGECEGGRSYTATRLQNLLRAMTSHREQVERTGEKGERDRGVSLSFHVGVFSFSFFYHLIQAF